MHQLIALFFHLDVSRRARKVAEAHEAYVELHRRKVWALQKQGRIDSSFDVLQADEDELLLEYAYAMPSAKSLSPRA